MPQGAGRKESIMLNLYYSALISVLAFLFLTFVLLPLLTSLIFYICYAVVSLFRHLQGKRYYW